MEDRMIVFNEMASRIEDAETQVQYYKSVFDGTWPNATHVLEHALSKVKQKSNK
jgi:hypothetical protein